MITLVSDIDTQLKSNLLINGNNNKKDNYKEKLPNEKVESFEIWRFLRGSFPYLALIGVMQIIKCNNNKLW